MESWGLKFRPPTPTQKAGDDGTCLKPFTLQGGRDSGDMRILRAAWPASTANWSLPVLVAHLSQKASCKVRNKDT